MSLDSLCDRGITPSPPFACKDIPITHAMRAWCIFNVTTAMHWKADVCGSVWSTLQLEVLDGVSFLIAEHHAFSHGPHTCQFDQLVGPMQRVSPRAPQSWDSCGATVFLKPQARFNVSQSCQLIKTRYTTAGVYKVSCGCPRLLNQHN